MDSLKNGATALVSAAAWATVRCRRNPGWRLHLNSNIGIMGSGLRLGEDNGMVGLENQYYLFNNQIQRTLGQHLAAGLGHHDRVPEKHGVMGVAVH